MRRLVCLFLLTLTYNCQDSKRSNENQKIEDVARAIAIPACQNWSLTGITVSDTGLVFNKEKVYKMVVGDEELPTARITIEELKLNYFGGKYRVSIKVKPGRFGNRLGLRIQEVYPVRTDIVFDLEDGKVLTIFKEGDLTKEEKSTVTSLGEGWYECTVTAKIESSYVMLIFGPTDPLKEVRIWESVSDLKNKNDLFFIPKSLKVEELED